MIAIGRGKWICIDGVEATGKTTSTRELTAAMNAVAVSEFSETPVGEALRALVKTSPHYVSKSALAQSLIFIGDFVELVHTKVCPALERGANVVTDRGFLSKYAYQEVVLKTCMSSTDARAVLDTIFDFLPVPDFTVLLTAPRLVLKQRLLERGQTCSDDRLMFMDQASLAACECLQRRPAMNATIIDSNRSVKETVHEIFDAISLASLEIAIRPY